MGRDIVLRVDRDELRNFIGNLVGKDFAFSGFADEIIRVFQVKQERSETVACSVCGGDGWVDDSSPTDNAIIDKRICDDCGGTGKMCKESDAERLMFNPSWKGGQAQISPSSRRWKVNEHLVDIQAIYDRLNRDPITGLKLIDVNQVAVIAVGQNELTSRRKDAEWQERYDGLEQVYRYELWSNHGHTLMYGDDGEMQCAECSPVSDYKRMPLEQVVQQANAMRLARLLRQQNPEKSQREIEIVALRQFWVDVAEQSGSGMAEEGEA